MNTYVVLFQLTDEGRKTMHESVARAERAKPLIKRVGARIRNYFLTGLVLVGPVFVTAYLTWSFINWVDGFVRPLVPPDYRPETYLPFAVPGSGLVVAFVALTLLGFLTANLIGRTLVDLGERLLGLPGEPRTDRDLPWSQVPRS